MVLADKIGVNHLLLVSPDAPLRAQKFRLEILQPSIYDTNFFHSKVVITTLTL